MKGLHWKWWWKVKGWKVLCHCYKDPTINGSNGYSKCERSYGLEQQRPGRQNGARNGGACAVDCWRAPTNVTCFTFVDLERLQNLHHRAARQSKRQNEISQRFELKGRFQGCCKCFRFLPSLCFCWINLVEVFCKVWICVSGWLVAGILAETLNHAYTYLRHLREDKPFKNHQKDTLDSTTLPPLAGGSL